MKLTYGPTRIDMGFVSLDEMLTYIEAHPPVWQRSSSVERGNREFRGTDSLSEAISVARTGWAEGRHMIVERLNDAFALTKTVLHPVNVLDVAGAFPCIPAAVAGDPLCMVYRDLEEGPSNKIVRIEIGAASHAAMTSMQEITNWGVSILSYIDRLEDEGYSAEVVVSSCACGSEITGRLLDFSLVAKESGEALDLDKLAFIIAHPSFIRRLYFAVIQSLKHVYKGGYDIEKVFTAMGVNHPTDMATKDRGQSYSPDSTQTKATTKNAPRQKALLSTLISESSIA